MIRKMNKRVCGVMLAAMMAAAVSVTACGGQGSTGETVTVQTQSHDDSKVSEMPVPLDGAPEMGDAAGQEKNDSTAQHPEDFVGMPNPFADNATLEEAEKNAGFSIQVPDQISGVSAAAFRNLDQKMLEVIYYNGEQEVARIRKSQENADNSGNYVGYSEIKNEKVGGMDVSLKGNEGKVVLAIWSNGAYSYSISVNEQGVSLEEMTALIEAVK